MPQLIPDWKRVLGKAWSVRLIILAGAFTGAEIALPFLEQDFPRGVFAALSGAASAGAFVMRLVAQKDMKNG